MLLKWIFIWRSSLTQNRGTLGILSMQNIATFVSIGTHAANR